MNVSSFLWSSTVAGSLMEIPRKIVMTITSTDYRTFKFFCSFSLSFGLVCALSTTILVIISVADHLRQKHDTEPMSESLQITPYISKPLEERKTPINFLPDTRDIIAYDDDYGGELIRVPELRERKPRKGHEENEHEALISVQMALKMKQQKKHEKAKRLFQHAMALHPSHPDILNHFGEFLEEDSEDIIEADHLYTRALIICPEHSKAMVNRKRTLPVVDHLDEKQLKRIDKKRDQLINIPHNDPSLKRMKKEAYFQHIYHTVAIEGNTMTLAETRTVVETRMAIPGKSIMEHNEILGLEAALRFINNTLVNKDGFIGVQDILQLHKRVLGNVNPIEAGCLRETQVFVGEHTPPSPRHIPDLMEELVEWLRSDDVMKLHPVKQAALAHHKLAFIHPFIDGNGRTARLLMNLILMRAGYPPVIVRKQDRSLYYKYLQIADEGDVRPFIRFIAESTEGTLDVYLYATKYGISNVKALEPSEEEQQNVIELES